MYTKRIQLANYGPIDQLDIQLPFDGDTPKPVVFVGENGSGKSLVLSHLVNGLLMAKDAVYPATPEVESGRVYKLRTNFYIKSGSEYSFGRVDFEEGFFVSELTTMRPKQDYSDAPPGIVGTAAETIWRKIEAGSNDHSESNLTTTYAAFNKLKSVFAKNCVLYFPFNRCEEPAWLNERNLTDQVHYVDRRRITDHTGRQAIAISPLYDNRSWVFDVIYDSRVPETRTVRVPMPALEGAKPWYLEAEQAEVRDNDKSTLKTVLQVVRLVLRDNSNASFRIARRGNRFLGLHGDKGTIVPDIFQLSSGETSLLNLFLSILRDFEWTGSRFSDAADIRGIVVVDEVDLHLHAIHQHEILPSLMKMFPRVQFIVTTHSPLFVLGMQNVFGQTGFGLYQLPQGRPISPEDFSEFGDAFHAFGTTRAFHEDVQAAIERSHTPIVFVEGTTDQRYMERASKLLGRQEALANLSLRDGGGKGNLVKIWRSSVSALTGTLHQQVLLLFDCDADRSPANKGNLLQRSIPLQAQNPINKGIENLFSKSTLEKARQHNPAFFTTEEKHGGTDEHGQPVTFPERWSVNDNEKANLCDWLCNNGALEDFQCFQPIFELLEEVLDLTPPIPNGEEGATGQ